MYGFGHVKVLIWKASDDEIERKMMIIMMTMNGIGKLIDTATMISCCGNDKMIKIGLTRDAEKERKALIHSRAQWDTITILYCVITIIITLSVREDKGCWPWSKNLGNTSECPWPAPDRTHYRRGMGWVMIMRIVRVAGCHSFVVLTRMEKQKSQKLDNIWVLDMILTFFVHMCSLILLYSLISLLLGLIILYFVIIE